MLCGVEVVLTGRVVRYAARLAGIIVELTLTEQDAVLLPSAVVTVMVALPGDMAVTNPLDDTVATDEALVLHATFLLVALAGATVAVNVSVPPKSRASVVLFKVTLVTATEAVVTVTAQVAVLLPSVVVTVIVALPADTAVTKPLDDTVATEVELLLHDTF
jgi:hypothetical protein